MSEPSIRRWFALIGVSLLFSAVPSATASSLPKSGSLGTQVLHANDVGPTVSALQKDLKALGTYRGRVDGIYGPETTRAVSTFQARHLLSATGIASKKTQILVVALNEPVLRPGEHGVSVGLLQRRLKAWGDYTGLVDRAFSPSTRQALIWFQTGEGLKATDVVNTPTWIALLGAPPMPKTPAPGGSPSPSGGSGAPSGSSGSPSSPGSSGASGSSGSTAPSGETILGYWVQPSSSPQDYTAHSRDITEIGPLWYSVRTDGSVKAWWPTKVAGVVAEVHRNGGKVLALVNNMGGSGAMLASPATRTAAVQNLVAIAHTNHLDGFNIDFEGITGYDAKGLVVFMKELYGRLHPLGLMTTIDVGPRASSNLPLQSLSAAYDYAKLAPWVDQMAIMTYDEHGVSTGPGPVSGTSWAAGIVSYALGQGVPAKKILLGLADYGYNWSASGASSIGASAALSLAASVGATVTLDPASGEEHFTYVTSAGIRHQVWFEDARSLPSKLAIVRSDHLGGAALWVLGEEDPRYLPALAQGLGL